MATELNAMPHPSRTGGQNRIYPWDEWANGSVWQVKRGEDFHVSPGTFRGNVAVTARRRGLRAVTSINGDVVTFQFLPYQD